MWESISDTENSMIVSSRLKVPGGWIVRTIVSSRGAGVAQTFIEDPDHKYKWKLSEEQV